MGLGRIAGAVMRHATTATRRALYVLFTLMVLGAAGPGARQGPAEGSAEGTSHEGAGEQGAAGLAEGTIATGSREEVYVYSSLERHTEDGPEPRYVTVWIDGGPASESAPQARNRQRSNKRQIGRARNLLDNTLRNPRHNAPQAAPPPGQGPGPPPSGPLAPQNTPPPGSPDTLKTANPLE